MLKITINAKELQRLLKNAGESIGKNKTLPILTGVLIEAEKGQVRVSSTNLEIGITTTSDCEVVEEGKIAVEYRLFNDIAKELNDTVEIVETERDIVIKSGKSNFKMTKLEPKEYPSLPKVNGQSYAIPVDIFVKMINSTSFAVSGDDSRPVLTGILLKLSQNTIEAVSIDGYRVAYSINVNDEIFIEEEKSLIIPGETMKKVARLIEGDMVIISTDGTFAIFEFGNTVLSTRLLEGQFISYKELFKQTPTSTVKVKAEDLYSSVRRAALVGKLIKLDINDGEMNITSNEQVATADERVSVKLKGEGIRIAFNPKFLLEGIKAFDTEEVELNFSNSNSPCVIQGVGDLTYKYLVLPVRLSN